MPIIVNTNISSMNARNSLNRIDKDLSQALERLASGLRINRSADDAAGLAIATGLHAQVRGLTQATRNAGDGLSVIGMADGAVNQQQEILQRIRELSVQAASDLNSNANRASIQKEIDDQVSELTRIGNTVEFNGANLINGSFTNKEIQVGAYANQTITVSIGDFRASYLGQYAHVASDQALDSTDVNDLVTNILQIDGVKIESSANFAYADTASTAEASGSAISKVAAINDKSGQTGVTAVNLGTSFTSAAAVAGVTVVGATDSLTINNVAILGTADNGLVIQANDANGVLTRAINAHSAETGVVASIDAAGKITFAAADGRNIDIATAGFTTAEIGSATATYAGEIEFRSLSAFNVNVNTAIAADAFGFAAAGNKAGGLDTTKSVAAIDVTTTAGAADAITVIDSALSAVADAQAELGGLTNRLENTIANLAVSIENLSASESRIRDADFAVETANLTRAQIIQQAGVAVLAQANLRPQAALALLG